MENSNNYIHSKHYKLNLPKNKRPTTKEILNFGQRNLKKNNCQVNKNYLNIYKFLFNRKLNNNLIYSHKLIYSLPTG